jgi:hypothetical protein
MHFSVADDGRRLMDRTATDRLVEWAETTFADREFVQKDELLAASRDADIPDSAKRALKELPQARWRREDMLDLVRGLRGPQTRADMREPRDGVPGGGHEGESEEPNG